MPVEVRQLPDDLRELRESESRFPGMEVRELVFDRRGEYFLRWETLPSHRDRKRKRPYPEPSRLRVLRRAPREPVPNSEPSAPEPASENDVAVPDSAFLEAHDARIGVISIEVGNVFDEDDPTEDRKLFRLVNRFRRKTGESVIRDELLFKSGDPYSLRLLEESERLLRGQGYLYEAEIRAIAYRRQSEDDGGEVDIVVRTRDVWTLTGGASLSRRGGENNTRFHLEDTNFLGSGTELGVSRESDIDRTRTEFHFRDFNLFGTRGQMEISLQENSDGHRRLLKLRRPFFALDTKRSKGITLLTEERIDPLFERGKAVSEFGHRIEQLTLDWGFSRGLQNGVARRWTLGFTFLRDRFSVLEGRALIADFPPDRTLSYPWLGFDWVEDRFIETTDLDKIARVEDLNLGTVISARAGWSSPRFGGRLERWRGF